MNTLAVKDSFSRARALEQGRESARKQAWGAAFSQLSEADLQSPLEPEDLQLLSVAGHLIGKDAESGEALARAHQGFLSRGEKRSAARCACWLSFVLMLRGDRAQASGWLARARRLLENELDCVEHGYLLLAAAMGSARDGDLGGAHAAFLEVAAAGQRFGDRDLASLGLQGQGRTLMRQGETARGVSLLDEAMVAVMAGEVSPIVAGGIYCSVIEACGEIFDLRRAREWTSALERWCRSQQDLVPYRGHCLIRRAEIMQMQGAWRDALLEAQCACERRSQPARKPALGPAFYRIGEMHRLRGDFAEAEKAYGEASRWERVRRPGLALLRLAQGRVEAAHAGIRQVADGVAAPGKRAETLSAYVEIALAANDLAGARSAADELLGIAGRIDAEFLDGLSAFANGAVLLAEEDLQGAVIVLRRALACFLQLEAPYDAARVEVLLACAYGKQGNAESAEVEFARAREIFQRLGAVPDLARLEALARKKALSPAGPLSPREVQVVQLVASGVTNREIAEKLKISEETVARHLSNIFNKLDCRRERR